LIDFIVPYKKGNKHSDESLILLPLFCPLLLLWHPVTGCRWRRLSGRNEYSHRKERETNGLAFLRYGDTKRFPMCIRGVRGAITVESDRAQAILLATRTLLESIHEANPGLVPDDLASAFFTLTDDLSAAYPAQAARELGWTQVPMLCSREIPVPGSLPRTVRVLLHWNTSLAPEEIHHVYLGEAIQLRPDLVAST
jgi:chorismate mutase